MRFAILCLLLLTLATTPSYAQSGTIPPLRYYVPFVAAATITLRNITYPSSIDPLTLTATIAYPAGGVDLPVLAILHGFDQAASDFDIATVRRFAGYGLMAVFPDMRGRGAAQGARDIGGREIQDIVDAINYVLDAYPAETDATQIHIVGYSGGGGNTYSALSRYPDFFNSGTSFFGISDYAEWYEQGGNTELMDRWIGGSPAEHPDRYQARSSVSGIANYTGGRLWMFHDTDDIAVPITHTVKVMEALDAAHLTNYHARLTNHVSWPRWMHALPNGNQPVIEAERIFIPPIVDKMYPAWTVPERGTLTVVGYVVTKRFEVWLRASGSDVWGLDAVAVVEYDTALGTYVVTPLTGSVETMILERR